MQIPNKKLAVGKGIRYVVKATLGLAILIASCARPSFSQTAGQQTFPSADAASQALMLATQSGNKQAVEHILGGGKEFVSSDDEAQDNLDRAQFAEKYQQMHRLVRESDGTTLLYIGAENWPFPVPLVSTAESGISIAKWACRKSGSAGQEKMNTPQLRRAGHWWRQVRSRKTLQQKLIQSLSTPALSSMPSPCRFVVTPRTEIKSPAHSTGTTSES
jgi:hypothetical protein